MERIAVIKERILNIVLGGFFFMLALGCTEGIPEFEELSSGRVPFAMKDSASNSLTDTKDPTPLVVFDIAELEPLIATWCITDSTTPATNVVCPTGPDGIGGTWDPTKPTSIPGAFSVCGVDGGCSKTVYVYFVDNINGDLIYEQGVEATIQFDDTPVSPITVPFWVQGTHHNTTMITATWSPSGSTDVTKQVVRVFTGAACTSQVASYDLSSAVGSYNYFGFNTVGYYFSVEALDAAGNSSGQTCNGSSILIDLDAPAAPTIGTSAPPHWWNLQSSPTNLGSVTATWTESADAPGDVNTQKLNIFHNSSCTGTPASSPTYGNGTNNHLISTLADGDVRSFNIEVFDLAMNSSISTCSTEMVIDTAPPIDPDPLALGWVEISPHNTAAVIATWTPSSSPDLASQGIQFYDDACVTPFGAPITGLSDTTNTQAISSLTDGDTYYYRITSTDAVGNSGTSICSSAMLIDTTAPAGPTSYVWTDATPHNSLTANTSWTVSASGDVAAQRVDFYSDAGCSSNVGSPINFANNTDNSTPFTALSDRDLYFEVTAIDAAGNEGPSGCSALLTIDTVDPTITSIAFSVSSPTSVSPFDAIITFSEDVSGFEQGDIGIVNGSLDLTLYGSQDSYTIAVTPTAGGSVTLSVAAAVAYDSANNDNVASANYSITYNPPSAPTAVLASGSLPAPLNGDASLNIDVEPTSGLQDYKYAFGLEPFDCSIGALYDPTEYGEGINITDAISDDGTYKVCVVGKNSGGNWQSYANATEYTWVTDTAPLVTFDGVLWVATPTSVGVSIDGGATFSVRAVATLGSATAINFVDIDNQGRVYVGTNDGLFRSFDNGASFTQHISGQNVVDFEESDGWYFAATTTNGLYKSNMDVSNLSTTGGPAESVTNAVAFDRNASPNKIVYVATPSGLRYADESSSFSTWSIYTVANTSGNLPSNDIRDVAVGDGGGDQQMFFVATAAGVASYDPGNGPTFWNPPMNMANFPGEITSDDVKSISAPDGGSVYFATADGVYFSYDGGLSVIKKDMTFNLLSNDAQFITAGDDVDDYVFVGHATGLSISDNEGQVFDGSAALAGFAPKNVISAYAWHPPKLYLMTGGAHNIQISSDGGLSFSNVGSPGSGGTNNNMFVDEPTGHIYVTDNGPNNTFKVSKDGGATFNAADDIDYPASVNQVNDFLITKEGTIYLATDFGVYSIGTNDPAPAGYVPFLTGAGEVLNNVANSIHRSNFGDMIVGSSVGVFTLAAQASTWGAHYPMGFSLPQTAASDNVNIAFAKDDGDYLFSTSDPTDYLYQYTSSNWAEWHSGHQLNDANITGIYSAEWGDEIYVGAADGVYRGSGDGNDCTGPTYNCFAHFGAGQGISNTNISHLKGRGGAVLAAAGSDAYLYRGGSNFFTVYTGANVKDIYIGDDETDHSTLFVGKNDGFKYSDDLGVTFENTSLSDKVNHVDVVDQVVIGADTQGLVLTSNGYDYTSFTAPTIASNRVFSFGLDPTRAAQTYVYIGTDSGLSYSSDDGTTFGLAPGPGAADIYDIEVDEAVGPGGHDVWIATDNYIWGATNGVNFSQHTTGLPGTAINDILIDYVGATRYIYAATPSGVYKSTGNGTVFSHLTNFGVTNISKVLIDHREVMFVASNNGLMVSTDKSTVDFTYNSPQIPNDQVNDVSVSKYGQIAVATQSGLGVSLDRGANFSTKFSGDIINATSIMNDDYDNGGPPTAPTVGPPVITGPPGQHVFVTNDVFNGNLGGLAGADTKCQLAADNASLTGGNYKAILGFSTQGDVHGGGRLAIQTTIYNMNSEVISNTGMSGLFDHTDNGGALHNWDEDGNQLSPGERSWANFYGDGSINKGKRVSGANDWTCTDWTNGSATWGGAYGITDATDDTWAHINRQTCDFSYHLYCISDQ